MPVSSACISLRTAEGIERPVDRDAMGPRAELRIPAEAGESAEDLDPDLLRDIRGVVGVTYQPAHDGVDARRVLRPERSQCPFVPVNRASNQQCVRSHAA